MATATRQAKGIDGAGITSLQLNLTSSTLAGSVLVVGTATGSSNNHVNANLATDSASETFNSRIAQVSADVSAAYALRVDDVLSCASGVTSVTGHSASSCEITVLAAELTGTGNAVRGSPPAGVTSASGTSVATNSQASISAGDIGAAFITDNGGGNTAYTVSPSEWVMYSYTPNGTNERAGGAGDDNTTAGTKRATFTLPASAGAAAAMVFYQGTGAAAAVSPPPMRTLRMAGV